MYYFVMDFYSILFLKLHSHYYYYYCHCCCCYYFIGQFLVYHIPLFFLFIFFESQTIQLHKKTFFRICFIEGLLVTNSLCFCQCLWGHVFLKVILTGYRLLEWLNFLWAHWSNPTAIWLPVLLLGGHLKVLLFSFKYKWNFLFSLCF